MIFYSHVNEDNKAEKSVMDRRQYDSLITVCGSGERVIALLAHPGLKEIEVIDINPDALYLLELKLAALRHCSIQHYLDFIGFAKSTTEKISTYTSLRHLLSPSAQNFWDSNPDALSMGILHIGHFERFLSRIRPFLKHFLGSDFYRLIDTPDHRIQWWTRCKWTLTKKVFSARFAFRGAGMKDESFTGKNTSPKVIPVALQQSMDTGSFDKSFMNHLIFHGHLKNLSDETLPPSFCPGNLTSIKKRLLENLLRITYHEADFFQSIQTLDYKSGQHRFYSLSDLLSFTDHHYLETLISEIAGKESGHFMVVGRSFLKNRIPDAFMQSLKRKGIAMHDCSNTDATGMYQVFTIEPGTE